MTYTIVFLRHGESAWNLENRFTGWTDVGLTEKGYAEAKDAGRRMKDAGFGFDVCFTSVLKRAILTMTHALEAMDLLWIPVHRSWRLNERHYGALTGLDKKETAARHGDAQTHLWRRSFDVPPPPLELDDPRHPRHDPRYKDLAPELLPSTESLKDVIPRVLPLWHDAIVPAMRVGKKVIVVAHGNSLRAVVKHLDKVPDAEIAELNIPTGLPLVYELDHDLRPLGHRYLASDDEVKAKVAAVAAQSKVKR